MKLKLALVAATLALTAVARAAVVDPAEPPSTPAGGAPEAGIGVAGAVGIGIAVAVVAVIAGAGDNDDVLPATSPTGTTGTTGSTGTL